MSATAELQRRDSIEAGDLVYFDTMASGRVPCKVMYVRDDGGCQRRATLKVTGARYAYPRGHVFTTNLGPFVQAR